MVPGKKYMILRIIIGGASGFAYYKLVGCSTGSCPLTSHPLASSLYGMVLGALVAGTFN